MTNYIFYAIFIIVVMLSILITVLICKTPEADKYIVVTLYEDNRAVLQQNINITEGDGNNFKYSKYFKYKMKWEIQK